MGRIWLATIGFGLSSCTMINPAFEDGAIADDEAAGSDDRVESSDSVGESGSGSGDEITSESGPDSTDSSESLSSESESTDGESESTDGESSTDPSETSDTSETADSDSTDTEDMVCAGILVGDECEMCSVAACCNPDNFECFDPENMEGCSCMLDCLSLGGLLDLCALDCAVLPLLKTLANTTFDCISQNCGPICP